MAGLPDNIEKQHIIQAIQRIDEEGLPSHHAGSQFYDLLFNNQRYPPKLVISYANYFANGVILERNQFAGGQNTPAFKLLQKYGFTIVKKGDPAPRGDNSDSALSQFKVDLKNAGLFYNDNLIDRFIGALITKPFVLLTGLSGSGKTKLAQSFVKWICADASQYRIVPVGADWTSREPLLGYPNALQPGTYIHPENKTLQLLIDASKSKNQNKPYFLILDEMNLSHVERYFADFLSAMESGESIHLHSEADKSLVNSVPLSITLPPNLFIVGTVNIDETTYMFSPKVLDRANVIEFRVTVEDIDQFLQQTAINPKSLNGEGASAAAKFLAIASKKDFALQSKSLIVDTLNNFFVELKKVGAEFGYRSASEIIRFVAVMKETSPTWSDEMILDAAILQKLLPKLHGSRRKLEPVLKAIAKLCLKKPEEFENLIGKNSQVVFNYEQFKYPESFEKIKRMHNNLVDNGFTSFAEA
jgi:5-methylcytosine-specific restriction protein B